MQMSLRCTTSTRQVKRLSVEKAQNQNKALANTALAALDQTAASDQLLATPCYPPLPQARTWGCQTQQQHHKYEQLDGPPAPCTACSSLCRWRSCSRPPRAASGRRRQPGRKLRSSCRGPRACSRLWRTCPPRKPSPRTSSGPRLQLHPLAAGTIGIRILRPCDPSHHPKHRLVLRLCRGCSCLQQSGPCDPSLHPKDRLCSGCGEAAAASNRGRYAWCIVTLSFILITGFWLGCAEATAASVLGRNAWCIVTLVILNSSVGSGVEVSGCSWTPGCIMWNWWPSCVRGQQLGA